MRKLRFRVANALSQGHMGSNGIGWNWKPGLSDCKTSDLKSYSILSMCLKKKTKNLIHMIPFLSLIHIHVAQSQVIEAAKGCRETILMSLLSSSSETASPARQWGLFCQY